MTFLSRLLRRPIPVAAPSAPALRGYAVCTLPRSGSNFFCDVLSGTGVLGHPREYFNGVARRG